MHFKTLLDTFLNLLIKSIGLLQNY